MNGTVFTVIGVVVVFYEFVFRFLPWFGGHDR